MTYKYKPRRALLLNREITWDGEISDDLQSVASVTTRGSDLVSIFFFDDVIEEAFVVAAEDSFPELESDDAVAAFVDRIRNGQTS